MDQEEIHRMAQKPYTEERCEAARLLSHKFSLLPDKSQAWEDLHLLTQDKSNAVRIFALKALVSAFSYIPDKDQAWEDLVQLTQDKNSEVRSLASHSFGSVFLNVPDKRKVWTDLIRLIQVKGGFAKWPSVRILYLAYLQNSDKKQALVDLHRLTQDDDSYVRVSANHYLGKAYILKATEAETEEIFRKDLEKALKFFEMVSKETIFSPTRFCLPFYRSLYAITFMKEGARTEVKKYLDEAKNAVEGSESKEKLLDAVENLANALKEVQEASDKGFNTMKCDLNAYRRYCERATDLLEITEEKAPGATRLIRRGLPIIDDRIKDNIAEIQEKAEILCKQTKDTSLEDLGKEVYRQGKKFSIIRDPIGLEKGVNNLQIALSAICAKMPENERMEACELLKKVKDEPLVEDKLPLINMILSKFSSQMDKVDVVD
ncbi:MAG: hypothetical protein WAW23_09995, partial [Candidatus Methanoperedens sp.]